MTKAEKFYRSLIVRFETLSGQTGKNVIYFSKEGIEVESEEDCKYFVTKEGVVYDNEEKVSCRMAKYDANLGMLY